MEEVRIHSVAPANEAGPATAMLRSRANHRDPVTLFGVVAQIEALGLELLELRQIPKKNSR